VDILFASRWKPVITKMYLSFENNEGCVVVFVKSQTCSPSRNVPASLIVLKSGSFDLLEPSGLVQACSELPLLSVFSANLLYFSAPYTTYYLFPPLFRRPNIL
jgi:hypothetical protein